MDGNESWDPLDISGADTGLLVFAQKREIANILRSYTGYYDVFAELIQNALDAVERRKLEGVDGYQPSVKILIDLVLPSISVVDNGCGMERDPFRQFLKPNYSFKSGTAARGCKGVGATYLAYGFNHVEIATKAVGFDFSGVIQRGRAWVDDSTGALSRPKVEPLDTPVVSLRDYDRGTAITIKLIGDKIRPKSLNWIGAQTADQWLALLRVNTPLGGIYLGGEAAPSIDISVTVRGADESTVATLQSPKYLYPHEVISRVADLREYLSDRQSRVVKNLDVSKAPPKYQKQNGLWGEWDGAEIIGDQESLCPVKPRLDEGEKALAREVGIKLYCFLGFSTELWDHINDKLLKLREGQRFLRGGLQLATKNMPQGMLLTIPMTNNIGFQNLAHIIVHFENAEPDLGRKGFQPEHVRLAEKISVSAVTAFRRHGALLRKPGVAKAFGDELEIQQWIKNQESHEQTHRLSIVGTGLFSPTEELPIRSEPLVEQDVVALFNQMLSSGLVRGVQLIASSQYKQYDGLFRIAMPAPFEKFVLSDINPLGIDEEHFINQASLMSPVKVLEYKFTLDGLVEELQTEVKAVEDIGLAVVWEMGNKWKQMFDATSYLDPDNVHHRKFHGTTHALTHSVSGSSGFELIVLKDLVAFLMDRDAEVTRQRKLFSFAEED